jgi:hypothetical protein
VRKWLESHTSAKVLFNPDVAHGAGLLLNPAWQQTILKEVMDMMATEECAGEDCDDIIDRVERD